MRRLTISLQNITCKRCIPPIEEALAELVSGLNFAAFQAEISFAKKTATVVVPDSISDEDVVSAIQSTGKGATVLSCESLSDRDAQRDSRLYLNDLRLVTLSITPMSCMKCVSAVREAISSMLSIASIPMSELPSPIVTLENQQAEVVLPSILSDEQLLSAIKSSSSRFSVDILSSEPISHPERMVAISSPNAREETPAINEKKEQDTQPLSKPISGANVEPITNGNQVANTCDRMIAISGMTCAACVKTVSDLLKKENGVCAASVNLLTARALLKVTENFVIGGAITALENAGYGAAEQIDICEQQGVVFLHFNSYEEANYAVSCLKKHSVVLSAEILSSDEIYDGRVHRWNQNRRKDIAIVRMKSNRKLEAVSILAKENLPYQVIPKTDPLVSGITSSSDMLRNHAREYSKLFWGSLIFTVPLTILTMLFAKVDALGAEGLRRYVNQSGFRVIDVIALLLATPVQFLFGFKFYRGAWYSLKKKRANMDVLIALGTSIAFGFSVIIPILRSVQISRGLPLTKDQVAFETAALIITIVLFGKWMESMAKRKTAAGVEALASIAPREVTIVSPPPEAKEVIRVPVDVELVSVGDHFRVNPGATFPLDGTIEFGETTVDESMLTGESWPVKKQLDDPVHAGTINGNSSVIVRCTAESAETVLEKIINVVKHAQQSKAPIEDFADRISSVFVPVVILVAVLAAVVWFALAQSNSIPEDWTRGEGNILFGLMFGLSVLVIACPCALGLATPTVIMMATSIGARRLGILYKDGGQALQAVHNAVTILFDKTGTLTIGKPIVTSVALIDITHSEVTVLKHETASEEVKKLLKITGAAESHSDHPLAVAICRYVDSQCGADTEEVVVTDNQTIPGLGVRCTLQQGQSVQVGKPEWILSGSKYEFTVRRDVESMITDWESSGKTVVISSASDSSMLMFGIEDALREEASDVVSYLQTRGIKCGIVSGDSLKTAISVATRVGIEEGNVRARALPSDKVKVVEEFKMQATEAGKGQNKGSVVFVGDGINDASALSTATVGIAMGSGSQVACESAGIVLVKSSLWDVVSSIDLAQKAFKRIRFNHFWAFCFNSIAIPFAAGAVYPLIRHRIPPHVAAAAMAASSLTVVCCSLSLARYRSATTLLQEESRSSNPL